MSHFQPFWVQLRPHIRKLESYRDAPLRFPAWEKTLHEFMLEQMRMAPIPYVTGDLYNSLTNPGHRWHFWQPLGNSARFGTKDPAAKYGPRGRWGWGSGRLPPIDRHAYALLIQELMGDSIETW